MSDAIRIAKVVKLVARVQLNMGGYSKAKKADNISCVVDHGRKEVRAHGPKGNEVGYLAMEKYGEPAKNNEVFNMAVKPAWQGKLRAHIEHPAHQVHGTHVMGDVHGAPEFTGEL